MTRVSSRHTARRLVGAALVLLMAWFGSLMLATPASADPVSDAEAALQSDNLYVAPDTGGLKVDGSGARSQLNDSIKVAILPSGAGTAGTIAKQIGLALDPNGSKRITIGVFVGHNFDAQSSALCSGYASQAAKAAVNKNRSQLQSDNDVTNTIKSFVDYVSSAPTVGNCSRSGGGNNSGNNNGGVTTTKKSNNGWGVLAIFGLAGAGVVGGLVYSSKRKAKRQLSDARAQIQPYYDRLASDINTLVPGDNKTAQQAMSDASERFTSGGAQLASADTVAKLGGARRTILEGLQATRTARTALGLDPGPELPALADSTAPQLGQAQQVNVNGQTVYGYPNYTPGAPYYFAGGGGYSGGWYSMPFWETLLIAEALTPHWGWGFGGGYGWGGGYGGGYGSGYDAGFQAGEQHQSQDSGWGGGDWGGGGGGGDWGGGGGGDWGGGGDFGGGGDSGGGSW